MDPWSVQDHVVGGYHINYAELLHGVDAFDIDRQSNVSYSVLYFSAKSYQRRGFRDDIGFWDLHSFQSIQQNDMLVQMRKLLNLRTEEHIWTGFGSGEKDLFGEKKRRDLSH
ncbi:hypothetical protein LXL04_028693 [Taraxacum kok-saghyz]